MDGAKSRPSLIRQQSEADQGRWRRVKSAFRYALMKKIKQKKEEPHDAVTTTHLFLPPVEGTSISKIGHNLTRDIQSNMLEDKLGGCNGDAAYA